MIGLKSLINIEEGGKVVRACIIAVLLSNSVSLLFCYTYSRLFIARQDAKIYALTGETPVMVALNQSVKDNREAEAKAQLREFHRLFFAINPDMGEINHNIKNALKMADASVVGLYQQLAENNYYKQLCDAHIRIAYKCDSIQIDFAHYPYATAVYGKTAIIRESGTTVRSLITTCHMRNVTRTDEIPNGFLIENFKIEDNTDLKEEKNIY